METKEELKRKIALCDKLGASKFQPIVLKMEELKFKVLKDIFPSLQTRYEKHCRKSRDKALKKAKTQKERDQILEKYRRLIIDWRKELKREQNRNYHMDENKPTEIIEYLNWNKKVHQRGLIKDAILVAGTIGGLTLGIAPIVLGPALALETLSAFINFQCVNIQNSHIYRYKLIEKSLKKREETRSKRLVESYGAASEAYQRSIDKSKELPTLQEMIENIKTPEEARQLRQMLLERQAANKKKKLESVRPTTSSSEATIETTQTQELTQPSAALREQVDLEIQKMANEAQSTTQPVVKRIGGK